MAKKNVTLAANCAFPKGQSAHDVGRGIGTDEGHCASQCAQSMAVAPSPVVGNINQQLDVNFRVNRVLGGANQVCASNGTIDWGDGTPQTTMPSDAWTNCDGKPSGIIHNTVGKAVNVTMSHSYATAGEYCVSASVWGNHKYDGAGSCSYDCTVSSNAPVLIRDVPPLKQKAK